MAFLQLTSVVMSSVYTVIIVAIMVTLFLVEHILFKRNEERLNKWFLLIIYIFNFIVLVSGIFLGLIIWSFDIFTLVNETWGSALTMIEERLGQMIGSLAVILVISFLIRIAKISFRSIGKKPGPMQRRRETIGRLMTSVSTYLLGGIAIVIILALWGVNVVPALAGLGIAGLVIGLGAQKFINDLISGFFIIFEHHFDVGDTIEVSGFKGVVQDIGLKTTRIKNWKGDVRILANGEISTLINYSKETSLGVVEFSIAYKEDAQRVAQLIEQELQSIKNQFPQVINPPTVVGVTALNSSSVDMRVTCLCQSETHYAVEREIRRRIKEICQSNGIEIPFPQVVVHQPR